MSKRFFMRFNLQNSASIFPCTAEVGASLLDVEPNEIQGYLDEFNLEQKERSNKIRKIFGSKLSVLEGKKVLFFGDSITSDNLGYRPTVCLTAKMRGVDSSISAGTSCTIIQFAKLKIIAEKPDIVSIMLGNNDSLGIGDEAFKHVSLDEYERNICALISWAKEVGAKVLLLCATPIHQERFNKHFNPQLKYQSLKNIKSYNERLYRIANDLGVAIYEHDYLKTEEDFNTFLDADGVHLSPLGQEQLAIGWINRAIDLFK